MMLGSERREAVQGLRMNAALVSSAVEAIVEPGVESADMKGRRGRERMKEEDMRKTQMKVQDSLRRRACNKVNQWR